MTLFELLSDPVRARIYIEILVNKEMTAQELMEVVDISRSTLSHHLTRFVEEEVFDVHVQSTGRSIKHYSIKPQQKREVIIKGDGETKRREKLLFLESASAHLQVISNLILERAKEFDSESSKSKKRLGNVTFTFHFMSKAESKIWEEEYQAFEKRFRERMKEVSSKTPSFDYIAFGGQVPTRKSM